MKKLLLVAALSVATTSVFAQAKNFEGFFVEGGLAVGATNSKATYTEGSYSSTSEDGGKDYLKGQVSFGYMKAINDKFLIGASVGTVIGSIKNAQISDSQGTDVTGKAKDNYSLSLIPAYALTDKLVVRGKISYNQSKSQTSGTYWNDDSQVNQFLSTYSATAKFTGMGLGIGAQYFITKNVYAAIDLERVSYSSKNLNEVDGGVPVTDETVSIKPTNTVGLISVGYKF
jgi:opacity protein-like surface antigen